MRVGTYYLTMSIASKRETQVHQQPEKNLQDVNAMSALLKTASLTGNFPADIVIFAHQEMARSSWLQSDMFIGLDTCLIFQRRMDRDITSETTLKMPLIAPSRSTLMKLPLALANETNNSRKRQKFLAIFMMIGNETGRATSANLADASVQEIFLVTLCPCLVPLRLFGSIQVMSLTVNHVNY
jgi:hypothetical protein